MIDNPFAIFFFGLIFLFVFSIYKYFKTKEKSYLLIITGLFIGIVGSVLSYSVISYENAGYIIMSIGYLITMIGFFILLTSRMEWSRKSEKKGLLYNPLFQKISVIAIGVLFIIFGIYIFSSDFWFPTKGAVPILWGVGFIVYAILGKRKMKIIEMMTTEKKIKTWLWTIVSLITSMGSLLTFVLYGGWHWHREPWEDTLPGSLGMQWSTAVAGTKDLSIILAVISLLIAIYVFSRKNYFQGFLCLPTCLLAISTIPIMT